MIPSLDASWEADLFGRIRRDVEANAASAVASAADLEAVRLAMQAELAALRVRMHDLEEQLRAADETERREGQIMPLRSVFLPPWVGGARP